jgi:2-dehydropantoate 2-reductase
VTRYIMVGAGAVGAGIGGRLFHAGHEVVLVARGEHLAAMRSSGLRIRTPEEDLRLQVSAVAGPAEVELRADDVLVLATKTHQAQDALLAWADQPVAGGGTAGERLPIVMALNGVASESMAMRYFARVYGACVWMWTAHLAPGEVIIRGAPTSGMFHLGRVPALATDNHDRQLLAGIRDDWVSAKLATVLPADVMEWKYRKLISNVGNAFQALIGGRGRTGAMVKAAEAEGRAVLDAAKISYTSDADEAAARAKSFTIAPVPGEPDYLGGSTWQSLARGTGNVETDYLNGELVMIARQLGIEAPINAKVAALVRQAAARGAAPGSMTVEELRTSLGL